MARVRSRSRFVQAEQRTQFVGRAQGRGESSARALRRYRAGGGKVSDRRWRELWAGVREHPETALPPVRKRRKVEQPGGYLYHVQLLILDMDTGKSEWRWYAVKSDRQRPTTWAIGEAMQLHDRIAESRRYQNLAVLAARVSSVERLV